LKSVVNGVQLNIVVFTLSHHQLRVSRAISRVSPQHLFEWGWELQIIEKFINM